MRMLTYTMKLELIQLIQDNSWNTDKETFTRYENTQRFDMFITRDVNEHLYFDVLSLITDLKKYSHENGLILSAFLITSSQSNPAEITYDATIVFYFEDVGV